MSKFKVTKIMIWPTRKVNLGNYNTLDLNAGIEISFSKPEEVDSKVVEEAYVEARKIVGKEFNNQYAPYRKNKPSDKKVKMKGGE